MKELFVPYKLSLLAKEKGFDEPCFGYYNGKGLLRYAGTTDENLRNGGMDTEEMRNQSLNSKYCSAPLYQQLIDWFREKKACYIELRAMGDLTYWNYLIENSENYKQENSTIHGTYSEALNKALEEAFKLIT